MLLLLRFVLSSGKQFMSPQPSYRDNSSLEAISCTALRSLSSVNESVQKFDVETFIFRAQRLCLCPPRRSQKALCHQCISGPFGRLNSAWHGNRSKDLRWNLHHQQHLRILFVPVVNQAFVGDLQNCLGRQKTWHAKTERPDKTKAKTKRDAKSVTTWTVQLRYSILAYCSNRSLVELRHKCLGICCSAQFLSRTLQNLHFLGFYGTVPHAFTWHHKQAWNSRCSDMVLDKSPG